MINTIIQRLESVSPAFYVTGLAVISLIIIMIRLCLITRGPYSEFSMNSVKTLMRLEELSFIVLLVSLAVGLYRITTESNWWGFLGLCFPQLYYVIKSCEFIINNPVNPRTKKTVLRAMIRFIIAVLIVISIVVFLSLVGSLEWPVFIVLLLVMVLFLDFIGAVFD